MWIVGGWDLIVSGSNVAFLRVECMWQVLKWNESRPLVFICPAGDGKGTITLCADRNITWHLITNISIHIRIDQILCRHMEVACSLAEFLPVLCLVKTPNRFERGGGSQRCPSQGNNIIIGKLNSCFIFKRYEFFIFGIALILERSINIRDDRSVASEFDSDIYWVAADDIDRFGASFKVRPFAINLILVH